MLKSFGRIICKPSIDSDEQRKKDDLSLTDNRSCLKNELYIPQGSIFKKKIEVEGDREKIFEIELSLRMCL